MNKKTEGATNWLYEEFARFYAAERCPWAPLNPKRVFNLAFTVVYPRFRDHFTPEQFLAEMYDVLGFRGADSGGLFATFDPAKYHGSLPLQNHFVNRFRATLEWRLVDHIRAEAKWLRRFRPSELTSEGEEEGLARAKSSDNAWMEAALLDLPDGLSLLKPAEVAVIRQMYWRGLSQRETAVHLGLDRGTVHRRHESALESLRAFYEFEKSWARCGH